MKKGSFQVNIRCVILLLAAGAQSPAAAAGYDPYGAVSLSGVYSTETFLDEVEELDGSALVARGYAGVRFNPRGNSTRFQVASNYFGYFDRENRWSNRVEAEQVLRLGNDAYFSIEASAASNVLTLERHGAAAADGRHRDHAAPADGGHCRHRCGTARRRAPVGAIRRLDASRHRARTAYGARWHDVACKRPRRARPAPGAACRTRTRLCCP